MFRATEEFLTEAWPTASPPGLNDTNFEMMIKNWDTPGTTCKDSWGRDCGTFWIFDLDDLEDRHGISWRIRTLHEFIIYFSSEL